MKKTLTDTASLQAQLDEQRTRADDLERRLAALEDRLPAGIQPGSPVDMLKQAESREFTEHLMTKMRTDLAETAAREALEAERRRDQYAGSDMAKMADAGRVPHTRLSFGPGADDSAFRTR